MANSHDTIRQFPIATKRSDKYLEEQYKTSGKNKSSKKSKKSKKLKHKQPSSESDEGKGNSLVRIFLTVFANFAIPRRADPQQVHVVSTFIEMPEGASVSDNENKDDHDADDPHKALDIDLDVYVFRSLPNKPVFVTILAEFI